MGTLTNGVAPRPSSHGTALCQHDDTEGQGGCTVQQPTDSLDQKDNTSKDTNKESSGLCCDELVTIPQVVHKTSNRPVTTVQTPTTTKTSDYHTLSVKDANQAPPPKAEFDQGSAPDNTPYASFLKTGLQDSFANRPSQLLVPPDGNFPQVVTEHPPVSHFDDKAFFKTRGTTLPSLYFPFKALEGPDPGGGIPPFEEEEAYEQKLSRYTSP